MVAYLDSSVVLRHILLGDISIRHVFALETVVSSELLEIECVRVLHRYRLNRDLDDDGLLVANDRLRAVIEGITLLAMTHEVKARAMGAFPVTIKTLDSLHLSTALVYSDHYLGREDGETLLLFSHDDAMNRCTRALGLSAPFA
ncbi:MAG: PIN domain-containing protein [Spirochaetales bacterium]